MERIVAVEEHMITAEIAGTGGEDGAADWHDRHADRLLDLGAGRLAAMDDQGVDVAVLSVTSPGTQHLDGARAVPPARAANDAIAAAVAAHPDRFQGFATLPTPDPAAAADELRRAVGELGLVGAMVHGRTGAAHLDDPVHEPIWAAAAALRAPVHLHPRMPPEEVRRAYYTGVGPDLDAMLAGPGLGWHYETGLQLVRMILGGVFDRHPDLQVIVGHWGEVVLFYAERFGRMAPVTDTLRANVSYAGSGMLSDRYLRWTREVVGTERILYSTDYPYVDTSGGVARRFLERADLTDDERSAVAHRNWERLTAHLR